MKESHYTTSYRWSDPSERLLQVCEIVHCYLPLWPEAKHSRYATWVLDYDYTASCAYRLARRGRWIPRLAGEAHLYPPQTDYWERPVDGADTVRSAWIRFDGSMAEDLQPIVNDQGYAVIRDQRGRLGDLLRQAARRAQDRGEASAWFVHGALCEILGWLGQARHVEGPDWELAEMDELPDAGDLVEQACCWIRRHAAENISLDDIARGIGVSRSTLSHRFREQADTTPITVLLQTRIDMARTLLQRGYKLQYIAAHTGFCDEYHLAKTFKRITGQTPGYFRSEQAVGREPVASAT